MIKKIWILILSSLIGLGLQSQEDSAAKLKMPLSFPEIGTLKEAGINSDSIANLLNLIKSTPPNDLRGVVVIKENKLVLEEYFHTYCIIREIVYTSSGT